MIRARTLAITLALFLFAGVAEASWYDDYEAGLAAARKGSWSTVLQKMNAAIKGNGKEQDKAEHVRDEFHQLPPVLLPRRGQHEPRQLRSGDR